MGIIKNVISNFTIGIEYIVEVTNINMRLRRGATYHAHIPSATIVRSPTSSTSPMFISM